MDDAIASRVTRKLTVRLVYFAGLLFFLNYLDRVNVGFAALKMNQDLGFTAVLALSLGRARTSVDAMPAGVAP